MSSHYQAPAAATPDDDGNLRIWSCVNCRRRKVKCERRDPCANCVRNNIECHFPVTGRLPRRSRDPAARSSPSQRQEQLLGRLQRLEALVTELSGQLEDGVPGASQLMPVGSSRSSASASASADKTPLTAGTEMYEDFGRLVVDQGLGPRVDRGFWSIFCDEVSAPRRAWHLVAKPSRCTTYFRPLKTARTSPNRPGRTAPPLLLTATDTSWARLAPPAPKRTSCTPCPPRYPSCGGRTWAMSILSSRFSIRQA